MKKIHTKFKKSQNRNLNAVRIHDKMYLKLDRSKQVKYSFVKILDEIKKYRGKKIYSLCDVGCASGDFLYAANRTLGDSVNLVGIDIRSDLLEAANKKISNCTLIKADINHPNFLKKINNEYDVVTMSGTMQIFDDFSISIDNCLGILKKKGILIVQGPFNPFDVDVIMRYRDVSNIRNYNHKKLPPLQVGFNMFSVKHVKQYIKSTYPNYSVRFEEILFPKKMNYKIQKNDLDRSWNINIENKNLWINGNQILQHQFLCKIIKK